MDMPININDSEKLSQKLMTDSKERVKSRVKSVLDVTALVITVMKS